MTDSRVTIITIPLIPPSLNATVAFESRNGRMRPDHKKFRDDVVLLTRGKKAPLLADRFEVEIRVYIAPRKWGQVPDIDNLPKALLDALKIAGVFPDDRFISDCTARRRKAKDLRDERTVITIRAAFDDVDEVY